MPLELSSPVHKRPVSFRVFEFILQGERSPVPSHLAGGFREQSCTVCWPHEQLSDGLSWWKVVNKSDVSQALAGNLIISREGSVR